MNAFTERPACWKELAPWIHPFLEELGHKNDGFWDDGVFRSRPFLLLQGENEAGFFALSPLPDGASRLHALYLKPEFRFLAQEVFAQISLNHRAVECMVPSNDELLLCLALEAMQAGGGSLELQAHNLTYGPPRREAEFGPEALSPVLPEEFPSFHRDSENMWLEDASTPGARFYRLSQNGETLGYGSLFPRRLDSGLWDVGNFVLPAHRGKGAGRSLIIQLSLLARADGKTPCAGCWYYNHASFRTLKSSGFVPSARIFRIHLHKTAKTVC